MNNSVIKAINLMEELARFGKPVALKDLARAAKLDKATAFRLLSSLRGKGFVKQTGEQRLYALGPSLLAFGEEYRRSFTMRDKVVPYLEQLVHATGETAIYCERYQFDSCVTIERRESPHQTRTVTETGIPRPLYAGSSALAILGMLPEQEIKTILKMKPLEKLTPFTAVSEKQILKKVDEIKRCGYAVSVQERHSYTAGVAAPCLIGGHVIGSIAIIGPAERIRASGIEKTGKTVKRIADQLAMDLRHSTKLSGKAPIPRIRLVK